MWRGQPGCRPGKWLEVEEHLGMPSTSSTSAGEAAGEAAPVWTQTGETKTFSSLPSPAHLPGISSAPTASSWQPVLRGQDIDIPALGATDIGRGPRPPTAPSTQSRTSLSIPTLGPATGLASCPPSKTLSLCVPRDRALGIE